MYEACQDSEIQRWTRVPSPYAMEDAIAYVQDIAPQQWAQGFGAHFAILEAESGSRLGAVGLVGVDDVNRAAEAGYWVDVAARRRGIARDALLVLTDWALGDGGLVRIELHIDPENTASRRTADAAGYLCEGVLRHKAFHRGFQRDVAMYARVTEADLDG